MTGERDRQERQTGERDRQERETDREEVKERETGERSRRATSSLDFHSDDTYIHTDKPIHVRLLI